MVYKQRLYCAALDRTRMKGVCSEGENGVTFHHEEGWDDEDPILLHISKLVLQSSNQIPLRSPSVTTTLSTPLTSQLTCSQVRSSGHIAQLVNHWMTTVVGLT